MHRLEIIALAIILLTGIITTGIHAQSNLMGTSGCGHIPSAYLLSDGMVTTGFRDVPNTFLPLSGNQDNNLFYGSIAFLPFLEIHATFIHPRHNLHGSVDRSICARLLLLEEKTYLPQLTLGIRDPVGGTTTRNKTGQKISVSYVVGSKTLDIPVLRKLTLHAGYGSDVLTGKGTNRVDYLLGIFAGIEVKPWSFLTVFGEYDTDRFNMGVKTGIAGIHGFCLMSETRKWCLGIGYRFSLTRQSREM